jgi:SAM-dependent methyltransferase
VTQETILTQAALWNGPAGEAWVEAQQLLDGLFEPFAAQLVAEAAQLSPRRVLDVGCGTGATTLAIARRLGASSDCVGVDISEPMLALARSRAAREAVQASFIAGDAQYQAFDPDSFDLIVSRFGVMFFDDFVEAFRNLRRAAKPGAALRCIAWRSATENAFMTTAERAAAPMLPSMPLRSPDGPGQFAFADPQRVRQILQASGWGQIDLQPLDVVCALPEDKLTYYVSRLGPVGVVLARLDEPARARVIETVRAAFQQYVQGDEVRFTAACWWICARAG